VTPLMGINANDDTLGRFNRDSSAWPCHTLAPEGLSEADSPTLGPRQPSLESRLGQARTGRKPKESQPLQRRQGDFERSVRTLRVRRLQIFVSAAEPNTSGDCRPPLPEGCRYKVGGRDVADAGTLITLGCRVMVTMCCTEQPRGRVLG
jgi:hypothetical protein